MTISGLTSAVAEGSDFFMVEADGKLYKVPVSALRSGVEGYAPGTGTPGADGTPLVSGKGNIFTRGKTVYLSEATGTIPVIPAGGDLDVELSGSGSVITHPGKTVTFEDEDGIVPVLGNLAGAELYPMTRGAVVIDRAHTLGRVPTIVQLFLRCTIGDKSYDPGDLLWSDGWDYVTTTKYIRKWWFDATAQTISYYVPYFDVRGPHKATLMPDVLQARTRWQVGARLW